MATLLLAIIGAVIEFGREAAAATYLPGERRISDPLELGTNLLPRMVVAGDATRDGLLGKDALDSLDGDVVLGSDPLTGRAVVELDTRRPHRIDLSDLTRKVA